MENPGWYELLEAGPSKLLTLLILIVTFALVLYRKVNITYVSLAAAGLLILLGVASPQFAIVDAVSWDVLAIYWGYGLLAGNLRESRLASWFSSVTLKRIRSERYALLFLCILAAALSSSMANPVVVIILAPIALEMARRLNASPFLYLVSLAISSNVVTTATMIADPPALILAVETGMRFLDFYWFQGRIGLGTLTVVGVAAALSTLMFQFRGLTGRVQPDAEEPKVTTVLPFVVFLLSAVALSLPFSPPWAVGLGVGVASLIMGRGYLSAMLREFDYNSLAFLVGIFILIATVERVGLLADLADWMASLDVASATLYLAIFVWLSVVLSSFIDNYRQRALHHPDDPGVYAAGPVPWRQSVPVLLRHAGGHGHGGQHHPGRRDRQRAGRRHAGKAGLSRHTPGLVAYRGAVHARGCGQHPLVAAARLDVGVSRLPLPMTAANIATATHRIVRFRRTRSTGGGAHA